MLRVMAFALLLLLAQTPGAVQNIPPIRPGDIVVLGGQLFDGTGDALVPNRGLVIRQGIFLEVGSDLSSRDLTGAEVIRLPNDQTILPGLFDLHAHYAVDLFGAGRVDE